jgi:trk system potassium uptake protein TrkH
MNYRLLSRTVGVVCLLIGASMTLSLPWAFPFLGVRNGLESQAQQFEWRGFLALLASVIVSLCVGGGLIKLGGKMRGELYRKEAMATVGLSWALATVLGGLPYLLAGVQLSQGQAMTVADCLFEAQSGFSTTGATVIADLETQAFVPHCILFWRSSTHFLGGLGIVVLFVAILGHGSAGKAMMQVETTGPTKEGSHARMQQTALRFSGVYVALNLVLATIYMLQGMSLFDALCHAFGTLATGGFSTYNASLGHFNSASIEYVTTLFMAFSGLNFMLIYIAVTGRPVQLLRDIETRVYLAIIFVVALAILLFGLYHGDFADFWTGLRHSLFQVVSIITTTGYGTNDFNQWNNFGRGILVLLMFIGGCAGSTAGGMKVIRHILFVKVLQLEVELAYRPRVIRPLRLGGEPISDPDLRRNILVYFGLIFAICFGAWLLLITFESNQPWFYVDSKGIEINTADEKLLDSASAVAATLHNIGPGLGVVGPTSNYANFSWYSKLLFVGLMMLGRLELFSVLVLFAPGFWRQQT